MRLLALLVAMAAGASFAQDEEWAPPPATVPPPPAPPEPIVTQPAPPQQWAPGPVPTRIPEDAAVEAPPTEPVEEPATGFRLAPTLNLLGLGLSPQEAGWSAMGAPSLRTGVRGALFRRSNDSYSTNLGLAIEVGLEGHRSPSRGQLWGLGITARSGPAFVTRGGLFFPFFEFYALTTLTVIRTDSFTLITPHFGVGLNFNAFAIREAGWAGSVGHVGGGGELVFVLLALVIPNVELVWSPPTPLDPDASTFEIRLGVGF